MRVPTHDEDHRKQLLPTDLRNERAQRDHDAATGLSVGCVAVGAILCFGVTRVVVGFDLALIGLILMIAGGLGLVVSDLLLGRARRSRVGKRVGQPHDER